MMILICTNSLAGWVSIDKWLVSYQKTSNFSGWYRKNVFMMVVFITAALWILSSGCTPISSTPVPKSPTDINKTTYWPEEDWLTSTPGEQNMDHVKFQEMMELIDQQDFAYDSVLVVRNGHIVFEEYRNGYDQNRKHHLQSVTKSFSSMLIGIAIQEGYLENVNQKMVDLFSGYDIANMDARKQNITLENLLTMSDGMDWHELDYPYSDPHNSLGQMWNSADAVQHVLDTPMAREPGESWAYNSGTSILLGGILEQITGRDLREFAREYLFDPIGIGDIRWDKTTGDHYHTDGGLHMTPRDMARFGYLMLNEGKWKDKEIVPTEWVQRSSEAHYRTGGSRDYGYQWWVLPGNVYAATGHYEQMIYVLPQADMVVVFTGYVPDDVLHPTDGLLYRHILAACTDLPEEIMHQSYEKYGFTVEYPTGFSLLEAPLPGKTDVSASSGMLELRLNSYPFELVQLNWIDAEPNQDLQEALNQVFETIPQDSGFTYSFGDSWFDKKDQHEALFQYFDIAGQGFEFRGLISAWHCDISGRVFITNYLTNPEINDQEMETRYHEHLDSITCHVSP